jgi:hypothetical protein
MNAPGLNRSVVPSVPRGRLRPDLLYVGWRPALAISDPGPVPEQPGRPEPDEVSTDWLAAQRREHRLLARPARTCAAAGSAVLAGSAAAWLTSAVPAGLALIGAAAGAGTIGLAVRALRRSARALRAQVAAEHERVGRFRAVQEAQFAARREEHARFIRDWQLRAAAGRRGPQWHPATVPASVSRIDVAGGTLAGWSALLTMLAAPRLAAGAGITILDLTEGAVAADLLALAATFGVRPLVWVLPADLPRLDLGLQLDHDSLAAVLALTAAQPPDSASAAAAATGDPARDAALIGAVLDVLGPAPGMPRLVAALRVLAQMGGPRQQLSADLLTAAEQASLISMAGRGAGQLVVDRAWALEARLRVLGSLGTAPADQPGSPLRVAWTSRHGSSLGNRVLASYLVIALTEELRRAPAGAQSGLAGWQQAVCVLGAERLAGEVVDRLCDAAEFARAGLLLGYRSIPPAVRERLGRGNTAVAFMRLGNAEEARAAAEQIGSEHRFVVSQLTETVGQSVTDTAGGSYTSTVGTADSVADSTSATVTAGRSRGRGRSRHGSFAPFADFTGSVSRDASTSAAVSDSRSVTEGINASTSWGWNTSRALGLNASGARTVQRSRELVIEQHELQHLPQTAVVLCQDGPGGREVILADANPAIMTLPTATLAPAPPRSRRRHDPGPDGPLRYRS